MIAEFPMRLSQWDCKNDVRCLSRTWLILSAALKRSECKVAIIVVRRELSRTARWLLTFAAISKLVKTSRDFVQTRDQSKSYVTYVVLWSCSEKMVCSWLSGNIFTFQQEHAPSNRSNQIAAFLQADTPTLIDPPNRRHSSPDLNRIILWIIQSELLFSRWYVVKRSRTLTNWDNLPLVNGTDWCLADTRLRATA